jgi:inner membrane protein
MNHAWIDALGWTATAVFVGSYFFSRPSLLRAVQMFGAVLWITYGLLIGASPVIVANALVFSAAAWTVFRAAPPSSRAEQSSHPGGPPKI